MKTTDKSPLRGACLVHLTWKYDKDTEIRRKVYLMPEDYRLLRKLKARGLSNEEANIATQRGVFVSVDTLSTEMTTVADISNLSLIQLMGHVQDV